MAREKKSKKRSGSTAAAAWQPSQTYFIDNALGRGAVPNALTKLGCCVELHLEHFAADAPDTEWIPAATKRGWAILTRDRRIKHSQLELATVLDSCACYVCVLEGDRTGEEIGRNVAAFIQKIDGIAAAAKWPVIMRVSKTELRIHVDGEWVPATAQHANPKWWRRRSY